MKGSSSAWNGTIIPPHPPSRFIGRTRYRLYACCRELLEALKKPFVSEDHLGIIVSDSLEMIKEQRMDTEDLEFYFELYTVIGDILSIDIEDHLSTYEDDDMKALVKMAMKAGIDLSKLEPPGH